MINHIMKTFPNIFSPANLNSSYQTRVFLHAIYIAWLSPSTFCEWLVTTCYSGINQDISWNDVNCIFKENVFFNRFRYFLTGNISFHFFISAAYHMHRIAVFIILSLNILCGVRVYSKTRNSKDRLSVERRDFLSKLGASTAIKHSPSCYDTSQLLCTHGYRLCSELRKPMDHKLEK